MSDRVASGRPRFRFITQLPRDDGCGVFVLQMLTGEPYDTLAGMIDWGAQTHHHTTWKDLRGVLSRLGWHVGRPRRVQQWASIAGVALVHVAPDHFMLYDAENALFYDPSMADGPSRESGQVPISYLPIALPLK